MRRAWLGGAGSRVHTASSLNETAVRGHGMAHSAQRLGVVLLVAGCSTTPVYRIGVQSDLTEGRIVTSRVVPLAGYAPEAGPIAGAMVGGVLGPLGGLVGAGMGYLIEWWASSPGEGIEYLVETDDGRMVTVVQYRGDAERPLPAGTPVRVETGALPSRVVEFAEAERGGAGDAMGSGWANPDDVAGSGWANPDDAAPPDAIFPPPEAADPLQHGAAPQSPVGSDGPGS